MAYDATKPTDDEYLSAFPAEMREQLRAIIQDAIVNALTVNGYSPGNLNGNIPVSNGNLNANLNADKLDGHDATYFSADGHVHTAATQSTNGFMSNTDKTKVDGIATGAEVNQNAFSNVAVGSTTIQADSKTDTLTLAAGANIAITPDATNDKITVAVTGTVPAAAAADTATKATNDKNGADIADTYLPKTGGTINGDITANKVYANDWLRTYGDKGWFSETYQGGWYMSDHMWIRAWNDKDVYTAGKMQADGGFYGTLHGTADNATNATMVGNKSISEIFSTHNTGTNNVNWNSITEPGCYQIGQSADFTATLGQPVGAYTFGILSVESYGVSTVQRYIPDHGRVVYVRSGWNGLKASSTWYTITMADASGNVQLSSGSTLGGYTAAQLIGETSHATNGYHKFPGGTIVQWGYAAANGSYSFPIVFPNACLSVSLTAFTSTSVNSGDNGSVVLKSKDVSGFTYVDHDDDNNFPVSYIAIGY